MFMSQTLFAAEVKNNLKKKEKKTENNKMGIKVSAVSPAGFINLFSSCSLRFFILSSGYIVRLSKIACISGDVSSADPNMAAPGRCGRGEPRSCGDTSGRHHNDFISATTYSY